jgi:HNH endonuclease
MKRTAEWIRLTRGYAARQGRRLEEGALAAAMTWADPERDVSASRGISLAMLQAGRPVRCVWTGAELTPASLDIDHAFPWAAWSCSDLWNLLSAHRRVNQHQKRDLLPSEAVLQRARDPILR